MNIIGYIIRVIVFFIALPSICILWITQFILFCPLTIISYYINRRKESINLSLIKRKVNFNKNIRFNRIDDVSKILGCNTRNVAYRWNIFTEYLLNLKDDLNALDFGAGSLRDSYELNLMGMNVDSFDVDIKAMKESYSYYDWKNPRKINLHDKNTLEHQINNYDLIIAFDVLEHLIDLDIIILDLKMKLNTNGVIFVTVPNRKSLFESYWRVRRLMRSSINLSNDNSGVSHVNFYTPDEWKHYFMDKGFKIIKHDMAIGFIVNDCWHGIYGLLSRLFLVPVIKQFCKNAKTFERIFYPKWLMRYVDFLDELTKPYMKHRWGWNLFILSK